MVVVDAAGHLAELLLDIFGRQRSRRDAPSGHEIEHVPARDSEQACGQPLADASLAQQFEDQRFARFRGGRIGRAEQRNQFVGQLERDRVCSHPTPSVASILAASGAPPRCPRPARDVC